MQTAKRRIAILMATCLLVALAFGGTFALAAWPTSGSNSLTVNAVPADHEYAEDISKANVSLDVVQIATAEKNGTYQMFDYTLVEPYNTPEAQQYLEDAMVPGGEGAAEAWENLAKVLAEPASEDDDKIIARVGKTIDPMADGLYLIMPHGEGVTDSCTAYSDYYEYTFKPFVVALPNKKTYNDSGKSSTADDNGEWVENVVVPTLKPERKPLYGDLIINKTVDEYSDDNTEPVVFVFNIHGTTPAGDEYDNYATVSATSADGGSTTVTKIPAGTTVTVKEVYGGSDYTADTATHEVTIVANNDKPNTEAVSVSFDNTFNNDTPGSGIENKFTFDENGDWAWSSSPEGADATLGGGDAK